MAVEPKITIATASIVADLNLAVQYGITILIIHASKNIGSPDFNLVWQLHKLADCQI